MFNTRGRRVRGGRSLPALALIGATGALALGAQAAHASTPIETDTMTRNPTTASGVISDAAAGNGKTLFMWANGSASKTLTVPEATGRIAVRARGAACNGAPKL